MSSNYLKWKRGEGLTIGPMPPGGAKFLDQMNIDALFAIFDTMGGEEITVFGSGEKFAVTSVEVNGKVLNRNHAYCVSRSLGLEYREVDHV